MNGRESVKKSSLTVRMGCVQCSWRVSGMGSLSFGTECWLGHAFGCTSFETPLLVSLCSLHLFGVNVSPYTPICFPSFCIDQFCSLLHLQRFLQAIMSANGPRLKKPYRRNTFLASFWCVSISHPSDQFIKTWLDSILQSMLLHSICVHLCLSRMGAICWWFVILIYLWSWWFWPFFMHWIHFVNYIYSK